MSAISTAKAPETEASKGFAIFLIITGLIGWLASFLLTLERFHVASDPNATLSCDVASFISCKSVMLSPEAKLFGFPNPLIGIAAFVAPIAVGFAILAGAKFANWFWRLFWVGQLLGFVFVHWLFSVAVYDIGALCPYCMVAWAAMIPLFWSTTLLGLRDGFLPAPAKSIQFFFRAYDWAWIIALVNLLVIALAIAVQFWNLWLRFFGVA